MIYKNPLARAALRWAAASTLLVLVGCSDDGTGEASCTEGALDCECTSIGGCSDGLVCSGAVCVSEGIGGTAGGGEGSGGASSGGGATGGANTVGAAPGGASVGGSTSGGASSGGASVGGSMGGSSTSGGASAGGSTSGGSTSGGASVGGGSMSGGTSVGGAPAGGAAGETAGGAGSGGAGGSGRAEGGNGGVAGTALGGTGGREGGGFVLTSTEFEDGGQIPDAHTCASGDFFGAPAPSLAWSGAPDATQSFALVFIDETLVDAGDQLGYHSAFWNLPASVMSLPAAFGPTDLGGAQTINDGYLGPCPNFGGGTEEHTYVLTLYALPESTIALGVTLDAQFIQTLEAAALASAELRATSTASNQ